MLAIRTILHPTDFSACAEAALRRALDLARQHRATVRLFHVASRFEVNPFVGDDDAAEQEEACYRRLRADADAQMQAMLAEHDTSGVEIETVYARGATPGHVITDYAASEDVDLIVLGTHGRRGLRKVLMGSVAEEVTHRATCPVLVVPEREAYDPACSIQNVFVPIDFSVYSVNALAYARQLAATFEAALHVQHVIDPVLSEQVQKTGLKYRPEMENTLSERALKKLTWLSGEVDGPALVDVTHHVSVGNPSVEITKYAEQVDADLIVIASHGLRGINKLLVGSVTTRVLRGAPCAVFMTRPFGKSLLPSPGVHESQGVEASEQV